MSPAMMLAFILGLLLLLLVITQNQITRRLKRAGNWNLNGSRNRSNDTAMLETIEIKEVSSPMNLIVQINSRTMPSLEEGGAIYEGRQRYSEYNGSYKTYSDL